jgi:hypothetical protein
MGRKKSISQEQVNAEQENFGGVTEPQAQTVFFKIATEAIIKNCNIKPKGADLKFDNLRFTDGQIDQLAGIIKSKEVVRITIEAKQGNFAGS